MYQTHRTFVTTELKMAHLIAENSRFLLMLEHFEIDFAVANKTVGDLCREYKIDTLLLVTVANLFNGFKPALGVFNKIDKPGASDTIKTVIRYLSNSHNYYKNEKYPEIKGFIDLLLRKTNSEEVVLIDRFFKDYFNEVLEHLNYEESVAFPYFLTLGGSFSAEEYANHHSDIETKLADLKSLLIRHINIEGELPLRRKLLFSLQELEYDLLIHAAIEENLLLPLIKSVESTNG